jgi:hypothetical protein
MFDLWGSSADRFAPADDLPDSPVERLTLPFAVPATPDRATASWLGLQSCRPVELRLVVDGVELKLNAHSSLRKLSYYDVRSWAHDRRSLVLRLTDGRQLVFLEVDGPAAAGALSTVTGAMAADVKRQDCAEATLERARRLEALLCGDGPGEDAAGDAEVEAFFAGETG